MGDVVEHVLLWGGGRETLLDSILALGEKMKAGGGEAVDVIITEHAAHVEMIVDKLLGRKTKGEGAVEVEEWLTSKI